MEVVKSLLSPRIRLLWHLHGFWRTSPTSCHPQPLYTRTYVIRFLPPQGDATTSPDPYGLHIILKLRYVRV